MSAIQKFNATRKARGRAEEGGCESCENGITANMPEYNNARSFRVEDAEQERERARTSEKGRQSYVDACEKINK